LNNAFSKGFLKMSGVVFSKWSGQDGIEQFIMKQTRCNPYSGAGINPRIKQKNNLIKIGG
jgi:hypothetical protein